MRTPFILAVALSITSLLVPVRVFAAPAKENLSPKQLIKGIVTTEDGKPFANATLYMLDKPGSQSLSNLTGCTVVTDANGHFIWNVPRQLDGMMPDTVDETAPSCYALSQDKGWTANGALARKDDLGNDLRELMEKAAPPCKTRWLTVGKIPTISIVAPNVSHVDLLLRGPDGRPLTNHAVELVMPDEFSNYAGAVVYRGQTDALGHLHWRGYFGVTRLLVSVPHVGFGSTGTFELLPNRLATPSIPPLAPFARVSGTVPASLYKAGAFVRAEGENLDQHHWHIPQSAVDAHHHFTIEGLLPSEYGLVLYGSKRKTQSIDITLQPGEQRVGLTFEPTTPSNEVSPVVSQRGSAESKVKPSISGKVTDVMGNSVSGVSVYAICTYQGAIRQYQEVLTAKTQSDGSYIIPNLPGNQPRIALVAVQSGRPLAFATAQSKTVRAPRDEPSEVPADLQADLVLPEGHPSLIVQVLSHGKPLKGALVRLTPQSGTGLFDRFYVGAARGDASETLSSRLTPTTTTNANGEVTFTDLTAGLWDITATSGSKHDLEVVGSWFGNDNQEEYKIIRGVAVQAGNTRRVALSIYPQPGKVSLQVLTPQGRPPIGLTVAIEYGSASSSSGSSTSFTVDKRGVGNFNLESSGLWALHTRFRDTPITSVPPSEPFYEASALVAISPSFPRTQPVVMRAVWRGRGRIKVQIANESGKPVAGTVCIGDSWDVAQYAASYNPNEKVTFADMPSGEYTLRASFNRRISLPEWGTQSAAFPSDATLTGVQQFLPQTVAVKSGEETLVTLRPQLLGYIRGKVTGVDDPTNYNVYFPYYQDLAPTVSYDPKTAEFVAGPFPAGKTALHVQRIKFAEGQPRNQGEDIPVTVIAGQVVHTNLSPSATLPTASTDATDTVLTMGGIFNFNRSATDLPTVFLPDGKTPAWGAQGAVFVPKTWQPIQMAAANALGRLSAVQHWYSDDKPTNPPSGSPTEPVLVAWLPGQNGAVIMPVTTQATTPIILPTPISVRGRVTVAGKPINGLLSSFNILAAYQGKGKLNAILSVETAAQPDGTFELSGLTPGTYQIQAARDGIWLSTTRQLVVGSEALSDFTLDIAPPGSPTVIQLVEADNKPIVNQLIELRRPPGPQTDQLWPTTLRTDSKGYVRLEGFEVGTHQFRLLSGSKHPFAFSVNVAPFATGNSSRPQIIIVR